MQLAQFLSGATSAPTRPVSFRAIGRNREGLPVSAKVRAVLSFIDEGQRADAHRDAAEYLAEAYKGAPVPQAERLAEELYHLLFRAIRDEDNPGKPFFETVLAVRRGLVAQTAAKLEIAYLKFVADEFPDDVTKSEYEKLSEEAEGESAGGQP